ncbi:MAG: IS1634 family transposase [Methanothrix sp.]|nr:IS1634 family transposase [Methanothrix sp.]MCX8207983.1 IS1634 family transposase [Methanothrix sp.]
MKSFIRVKKIHGHEYLYEITPYYDKEKKQVRQKSKYLGKNVNGVPVKVRSQGQIPKKVLSYGEFLPLKKIAEDLKLEESLSGVVPDNDIWPILTLAMNYVTRPLALTHIQSWYEGTVLSEEHPDIPLSSQSISRMLSRIGDGTANLEFSCNFIKQTSTGSTLVYDITSLSSYSQSISLLEYGYNRDGLSLPQINLSLVVDKDLGIPVMYDLYPGSIADVSTLKNTVAKLRSEGVNNYTLILDRGFFSTDNIEEMISAKISFIIPPNGNLKSVKEAISAIHNKIGDPEHLKMYEKEPMFVMPVSIDVGKNRLNGYAYYDQKREQQERNSFYKRLYDLMEVLKSKNLKPWMDPAEVFKAAAKNDAKFIEWTVVDGKFQVSLRRNAVSQAVNKMGKFILLYNGNFSWEECLSLYRGKDVVEKGFSVMKNNLDVMPSNLKTNNSLRGYLFVAFLALILRMKLMRMMIDAGLSKKMSVDGLLTDLEKIKILVLPNGERITTEISKKQRDILDALHICA